MPQLINTEKLTERFVSCAFEARELVSIVRPGQVVLARFSGEGAWLPLPIADFDREQGTLTVVADRSFIDPAPDPQDPRVISLSGPYGKSLVSPKANKILFVAEGLGVAAIFPRLREAKLAGTYAIVMAGFHSKDCVYWLKRIDEFGDELYAVTEDGSFGIKGPLKHTLKAVCENSSDIEQAVVIGPLRLLKACSDVTLAHELPTVVSPAAVIDDGENGGPLSAERAEALARYGWANESDLDAHKADFDALAQRLGIQTVK